MFLYEVKLDRAGREFSLLDLCSGELCIQLQERGTRKGKNLNQQSTLISFTNKEHSNRTVQSSCQQVGAETT